MDDFNDLINDVVWDAKEVTLSQAWVTGIATAKRAYDKSRQALLRCINAVIARAELAESENARLTAEVEALKDAARWIPVSERLPEGETDDYGTEYLVIVNQHGNDAFVMPAEFRSGKWYTIGSKVDWWNDAVTHYQPLPQPPEAENE